MDKIQISLKFIQIFLIHLILLIFLQYYINNNILIIIYLNLFIPILYINLLNIIS